MKATTQIQATRVAEAGAKKMEREGYTFTSQVDFLPIANQTRFTVKKADGTRYNVNLHSETCNCPFYRENSEFKACKHLTWMASEKAQLVDLEARAEVYAQETADYDPCGKY